jgi:hypothetical protein
VIPNRVIIAHDAELRPSEIAVAREYIDEVATTLGTGGLMGPIIRPPYPDPFNRIVPWIHWQLFNELADWPDDVPMPRGDAISLKLLPGVDIRRHNHNDTPAIGLYYFSDGAPLTIHAADIEVPLHVTLYGRQRLPCDFVQQYPAPGMLMLMDGALEHDVSTQPGPDARYTIAVVWRSGTG